MPKLLMIKIKRWLRKLHLLSIADYFLLLYEIIKNYKKNKTFLKFHKDFSVPPYILAFDAYGTLNWEFYYNSGVLHAKLFSNIIEKYYSNESIKILDWGCGPGRIIRHLHNLKFRKVQLYGTDYNPRTIKWCNLNLKNINFTKNNLAPPLPYNDGYFDCIYALSVFTHLSEDMHFKWIKELYRILNPDGLLIITTHGDNCLDNKLLNQMKQYQSGKLVIEGGVKEGKKHFIALHPSKYVEEKLLADFKILEHITNASEFLINQDIWVSKKIKK